MKLIFRTNKGCYKLALTDGFALMVYDNLSKSKKFDKETKIIDDKPESVYVCNDINTLQFNIGLEITMFVNDYIEIIV